MKYHCTSKKKLMTASLKLKFLKVLACFTNLLFCQPTILSTFCLVN
jgi:hypothetical protein